MMKSLFGPLASLDVSIDRYWSLLMAWEWEWEWEWESEWEREWWWWWWQEAAVVVIDGGGGGRRMMNVLAKCCDTAMHFVIHSCRNGMQSIVITYQKCLFSLMVLLLVDDYIINHEVEGSSLLCTLTFSYYISKQHCFLSFLSESYVVWCLCMVGLFLLDSYGQKFLGNSDCLIRFLSESDRTRTKPAISCQFGW